LSVGVANIAAAIAAIVAVVAGFAAAGLVVAFAAGAEIIRRVASWQLNGKLICLKNVKRHVFDDPDSDHICVLGSVLYFEKVGEDKSGFENIDNDFAVNLFLAPFSIGAIASQAADTLQRAMERSPQGDLVQNPDAPKPTPGDPNPGPEPLMRKDDPSQKFGAMPAGFTGYQRGMMISSKFPRPVPSNVYRDPHELVKLDPKLAQMGQDAYEDFVLEFHGPVFESGQPLSKEAKDAMLAEAAKDPLAEPRVVANFYQLVQEAFAFAEKNAPALHCEFEGSRIRDVYNVLDFAHVHCDTSGFWGFLCDVLNLLISIFLGIPKLIAAAFAWANADDGSLSDAYDGAGGEIRLGDPIVVRGRWVYDSAHTGYNEIHAVRTVQKTLPSPHDIAGFKVFMIPGALNSPKCHLARRLRGTRKPRPEPATRVT